MEGKEGRKEGKEGKEGHTDSSDGTECDEGYECRHLAWYRQTGGLVSTSARTRTGHVGGRERREGRERGRTDERE